MQEREAQCLLGNGICPKTCRLYGDALEITNELGDDFDPNRSRQQIFFADAHYQGVNVVQVAETISRCETESAK